MFQLGSALLDACVLAVLSKGDTYGYELTQSIRSIIEVSESTLYPVLRRLQKEQLLTTYDSPFNGRNRRYYQITPQGVERLAHHRKDWQQFKTAVEFLLGGALAPSAVGAPSVVSPPSAASAANPPPAASASAPTLAPASASSAPAQTPKPALRKRRYPLTSIGETS